MIELLLAKGAYVDPIADEIGTPLCLATKEQKVGAMKTLLDHNTDCNKTYMMFGLYPMTPLFQAVNVSSVQCVKLLVEAAACPGVLINNRISDGLDETRQRAQHLVTIGHAGEYLAACPRRCSWWAADNTTEKGLRPAERPTTNSRAATAFFMMMTMKHGRPPVTTTSLDRYSCSTLLPFGAC